MVLSAEQVVPRRPFTSVTNYQRDRSILSMMLNDLRSHLSGIQAQVIHVEPYERVSWTKGGLIRRILVSDHDRLQDDADIHVVGFFANRHPDVDPGPLERMNAKVVKEFRKFPSIISYSSAQLPSRNWANLVVNETAEAAEHWRSSEAHKRAVQDLSPRHYLNVRIHLGRIAGGICSGNPIEIERTKYYDYRASTVWSAVREFSTPTT